jgi:hypothetical protein
VSRVFLFELITEALRSEPEILDMDDDLVLNLAADDDWAPKRAADAKKGGKWTER